MSDTADFSVQLKEMGLGHLEDKLKEYCVSSIHLVKGSIVPDDSISIGRSKFGGSPDLPADYDWPTCLTVDEKRFRDKHGKVYIERNETRNALAFVGQLNLEEIPRIVSNELLPRKGLLSFFYDRDQMFAGIGNDIENRDRFRVCYHEGPLAELLRRSIPESPEHYNFHSCELGFTERFSCDINLVPDLTDEDVDELMETLDQGLINKMFGYPDAIQDPNMAQDCEKAHRSLYKFGGISNLLSSLKDEKKEAKNWVLLLQVDSNEELGMMWVDVGRLYFWIKKDDLAARRFERTWCILECS